MRFGWIIAAGLALASMAAVPGSFDMEQRKAAHWCWQPIKTESPPEVKHAAWAQSPIDRFILARHEKAGLEPSPAADRHVLIRRAFFDLIGLPPTPKEVDDFVNDTSPDAFAKVVDHLLASHHFGERWARHWLDLVRYGETRGHEFDPIIPNAWQYRDYLIRAFNADVPYNQFVTEHVAGDLMEHPRLNTEKGFNESILGTGFWFLGEEVHSPVDIRQDEADRLNNRVDTFSKTFLGLTVGCARCHEHKFDAISQKDFYALTGFTLSAGYRQVPFMSMEQNHAVAQKLDALRTQAIKPLTVDTIAALRPGLERTAECLLAAKEILASGAQTADKVPANQIDAVAEGHSVDPTTLRAWVAELIEAQRYPDHVFHAFATIAREKSSEISDEFAKVSRRVSDLAADRLKQSRPAPDQVLLDYDGPAATAPWYSDGVGFGLHAIAAGQVIPGDRADQPIAGVAVRGMARRDFAFKNLHVAPGTETDLGDLGNWNRGGQTIRTLKVTLKTGKLWYLVRGSGRAYAVVDSHLIIAGPLHGSLLHQWQDKGDQWKWIGHNMSAYAGHRCHVEFSPVGTEELEIAKVIEADSPPPATEPNQAVLAAIADPSVVSVGTMALAYQKVLTAAAERLAAGTISGSSDMRDQALLADLIVRHPQLFSDRQSKSPAPSDSVKAFIAAQADLMAKVVNESPTAMAMLDGNGVDENLLIRGSPKTPADVVPRHFLEAVAGASQAAYPTAGSGRMQLVQAMLAGNDPFVPRVMVNRVWEHLFGRGIVATVDNFGVLGQAPTHPELLDYLADHFRTDQGWSVKKLIRSIVLSSTYQTSSKALPKAEQADPQNLLLTHMPIRRLEGEALRDAILAVSGRLNPKLFGPPVEVHLTEFMDGRGRPGSGPLDGEGRRSIYGRVRRNFLSPMMLAFDTPNPAACVGRRNMSNVPAQALILMNDPMVIEQANVWAKRLVAEPKMSASDRIVSMYQTALSRDPKPGEVEEMQTFLDDQGKAYGIDQANRDKDARPWADLCHVMFNLKEFAFVQ